ncbi:MAG: RNA pseudouridine synthase, partial [Clostridia bacterium]|nr:RNA pseudouridine synthase [Clostridia bacterium]
IRLHAKQIGHPVVGDPLYANGHDAMGQTGQLLHAAHIGFTHPITGEDLSFNAPLPQHMSIFLEKLRKNPHETL